MVGSAPASPEPPFRFLNGAGGIKDLSRAAEHIIPYAGRKIQGRPDKKGERGGYRQQQEEEEEEEEEDRVRLRERQ
jgi:hypothetical protein